MTTPESLPPLLPCPFCGRTPKLMERPDNAQETAFIAAVVCYCGGYASCAHKMVTSNTQAEATRAVTAEWNQRAALSSRPVADSIHAENARTLQAVIEELRDMLGLKEGDSLKAAVQGLSARQVQPDPMPWYEGPPPFPQDQEWFIAETTYGDRVVLRSLDEGRKRNGNYAFRTADDTYLKEGLVKRWMQFPDCEYLPPAQAEAVGPVADYGGTDFGWTYAIGRALEPQEERLMAMLVKAFGSHHPAIDDMANLIMTRQPAPTAVPEDVRRDAERWQAFVAAGGDLTLRLHNTRPDGRNAVIDAALAAQAAQKGEA